VEIDRHKIWRIVRNNHQALEEHAPDGYNAVVEVTVAGRAEPVVLGEVHTSRDPLFPWILLAAEAEAEASPDAHLVFVTEPYIQRVEIKYKRSTGRTLGFAHRELAEPPDSAEG
jgi:hypothetical protein